jgi:broad specificity phosphatase PhoE
MELFFVRHGQGEHNLNVPDRLNIEHPRLTDNGIKQVRNLKANIDFNENDLFVVSPTVRTIETARILTEDLLFSRKYISPVVGPRVFPLKKDSKTMKCDITLTVSTVKKEYTDFKVLESDKTIWDEGINIMSADRFAQLGEEMIRWIKNQENDRTFIIAHDGTITNYRQLLGEEGLTRSDFLGEAGVYKLRL